VVTCKITHQNFRNAFAKLFISRVTTALRKHVRWTDARGT